MAKFERMQQILLISLIDTTVYSFF